MRVVPFLLHSFLQNTWTQPRPGVLDLILEADTGQKMKIQLKQMRKKDRLLEELTASGELLDVRPILEPTLLVEALEKSCPAAGLAKEVFESAYRLEEFNLFNLFF